MFRTNRNYGQEKRIWSRKGFTLIELLVVMVILSLLAAFVGTDFFKHIGTSKQKAAKTQIEMFGTALDSFRLSVGRYPTTAEGMQALRVNPGIDLWDGPYLRKDVPMDPWGRPYVYNCPGQHGDYDLISYGADGQEGGEGENADVVSWK
ncbi:MAG: type II secretion system major pseudopilin GspG [Syntrophobacteraceae bacterium]|jgi:general secretion pathway protein G